ncbi:MAG: hypothetical protein ACU83N_14575 [Gammaproteobacteria bacterium]
MKSQPDVFIYAALPCEAKPLIGHFRLKRKTQVRSFAVYRNEKICLTVTGLGKNAMAAGVAYTQALFSGIENPAMINVGVAGHQTHTLGSSFIGHKITDADTGKNFYPVPACSFVCASEAVVTSSRPQLDYAHPYLCDMEASAFYETAVRFSTGELVQCLKIVSDNREKPADGLDAGQVAALIEANTHLLEALAAELSGLARRIDPARCETFDRFVQQFHFSVTEQNQLKSLLLRWQALTEYRPLEFDHTDIKNAKDVLRWLEHKIGAVEVFL